MNDQHYQDFIDKVLDRFAADISDRVFMMIQGDKELMREYLRFVRNGTDYNTLNCELGKRINERFNLRNTGRCKEPQSALIESYEGHEVNKN